MKNFFHHRILKTALVFVLAVFSAGCVSHLRKSPNFDQNIKATKIIAVMPPDIKVFKLTAGGIPEQIDEWSESAQQMIAQALKEQLSGRYGFEIKFIEKEWLKQNYKEIWNDHRALYEAVGLSAVMHAYKYTGHAFRDKVENFDYTLGPEVAELAEICGADALLFANGWDYEATAGRTTLSVFSMMIGGPMLINPSALAMGLVDGKTGEVEWFKHWMVTANSSFRDQKGIDKLIEWFTKDFLTAEE